MSQSMTLPQITTELDSAVSAGRLSSDSRKNALELLGGATSPLYAQVVAELIGAGAWKELDDRFFRKLSFGTSGLRGRTVGNLVTMAELGQGGPNDRPEHPCVGTNAMNYYNVSRATRGLIAYVKRWLKEHGESRRGRIVFSHDTRHFSRDFAEFCARIANDLGVDAYLFESHRATPELSYAVRQLCCDAGVMCTASHNPAHDNGYKVYFNDGSSIIDPVAPGILQEVNAITQEAYDCVAEADRGKTAVLGREMDDAYVARLKDLLLDPAVLEKGRDLKIVYTALHGAGGVLVPRILDELGFNFLTVPEQDVPDGRFPTVKSPNPENAPALQMGIDLAEKEGADIVIGTDPDCDRMGVVVRNGEGKLQLITGNQIGSAMAWYRVKKFFELGILTEENKKNAVLIKTFVTTDLQKSICQAYGIRCVETLTGFKYIGAKLGKYEHSLPAEVQAKYRQLTEQELRQEHLSRGSFFVFGGEESYGYQGADFVRDKDGNGAVVMFAELAAYAKSRSLTVVDLLDEIYCTYGYFLEKSYSKEFEGAEGAKTMLRLMKSYSEHAPTEIGGKKVVKVTYFGEQDVRDVEGDLVPKETMIFIDLEHGVRFAVRPSGTEPKIKYYFFGRVLPKSGQQLDADLLPWLKLGVAAELDRLWTAIDADIKQRLQ